ncbi:MAG: hypothetical protein IJU52_08955 [Clostridia bacterium]|nr:hypothetical protein [Clostridia bacterium]
MEITVEGKYLMYKGKPLVRQGNQICYGSMQDEYVMYLMILSNKEVEVGGVKTQVPDRVIVQILKSDPTISPLERMVKQFDKKSLYDAFNDGIDYLERLLSK